MTTHFKLRPAHALAAALLLAPALAPAETIDFEDAVPENVSFVAQGYKGFQWGGGSGEFSWVLGQPSQQNIFTPHSGVSYIWSNGGTSLTLSDGLFDFNSMWVRSGQNAGTDTAHGFLNGVEIYTQGFSVGTDYAEVTLNFVGIDTITFDVTPFNVVMDDININAAAPEPASLALLGLGLLGLGFGRRRNG